MPDPRQPGVFVDEVSGWARRISAVPISAIGMVGLADRGPVDRPTLVTSFEAFQRVFGGFRDHTGDPGQRHHLVHAVKGAFDMGAQIIHVTRVLGPHAAVAKATLTGLSMQVHALHPGQWGNRLRVSTEPQDGASSAFTLTVELVDSEGRLVLAERFYDLALDPTHPRHAPLVLQQSALVRLSDGPPEPSPLIAATSALAGGKDDLAGMDDDSYIGAVAGETAATGLQTLCDLDEIGVVAIPGQTSHKVQAAMVAHCKAMRYRIAVLDSVPDANAAEVLAQGRLHHSAHAALYYPWLVVDDPAQPGLGRLAIPPSGHVCGAIAKTDRDRGVHKAPANVALNSLLDVERKVTKAEQDRLNPFGVNVIRDFRAEGRGIRIWGGRTLSSDPEWKYIPVRRLVFLVEKSIERGLSFVVFEPQSPALWAEVRRLVEMFLQTLWRAGALAGTRTDEAYFVEVGPSTMTQSDIDAGLVILRVGLAPLKPAEFVICQIVLKASVG